MTTILAIVFATLAIILLALCAVAGAFSDDPSCLPEDGDDK
jgi:hypothetical protein